MTIDISGIYQQNHKIEIIPLYLPCMYILVELSFSCSAVDNFNNVAFSIVVSEIMPIEKTLEL